MIVIPLAGLSRRCDRTGRRVPLFMHTARGRSVLRWAVEGFAAYFGQEHFLFVLRDTAGGLDFAHAECRAMGLGRAVFVALEEPTQGPADTVRLGLELSGADPHDPLTVFTAGVFRPGFRHPAWLEPGVNYLEVFAGQGDGWCFAKPDPELSGHVQCTAENRRISDLCCTGLYHFARVGLFLDAVARQSLLPPEWLDGEALHVAPLYNELIAAGHPVRYARVRPDEVVPWDAAEASEFLVAAGEPDPGEAAA